MADRETTANLAWTGERFIPLEGGAAVAYEPLASGLALGPPLRLPSGIAQLNVIVHSRIKTRRIPTDRNRHV